MDSLNFRSLIRSPVPEELSVLTGIWQYKSSDRSQEAIISRSEIWYLSLTPHSFYLFIVTSNVVERLRHEFISWHLLVTEKAEVCLEDFPVAENWLTCLQLYLLLKLFLHVRMFKIRVSSKKTSNWQINVLFEFYNPFINKVRLLRPIQPYKVLWIYFTDI